jgi:hypothetical protein
MLGAMFVASFGFFRWMESFVVRTFWLLVVMPVTCLAFGVPRRPTDGPPRFGLLVPAAAVGWLDIGAWIAVVHWKHSLGDEALGAAIDFLCWTWPIPPALSLACLVVAAVRPGRYRELAIFANAALLLVFAWGFDNALSPK